MVLDGEAATDATVPPTALLTTDATEEAMATCADYQVFQIQITLRGRSEDDPSTSSQRAVLQLTGVEEEGVNIISVKTDGTLP